MKKIYQSDKTLTFVNKSSNMYRLTKEEYVKMRKNAITSTTKKQSATSRKEPTLKENKLWKMWKRKC